MGNHAELKVAFFMAWRMIYLRMYGANVSKRLSSLPKDFIYNTMGFVTTSIVAGDKPIFLRECCIEASVT